MPSSLSLDSAPMRASRGRLRVGVFQLLRIGGEGEVLGAHADEEEGRAVAVGTPDDGLHVKRAAVRQLDMQPRLAAHLKGLAERNLGAEGTQVHGLQMIEPLA